MEAWSFPESFSQGIVTTGRPLTRQSPARGRVTGLEVTLDDGDTQYRLRYDPESGHLRGTLNGGAFWAVPLLVVRPGACPGVP